MKIILAILSIILIIFMAEITLPQQNDIYSYGFDKSLNRITDTSISNSSVTPEAPSYNQIISGSKIVTGEGNDVFKSDENGIYLGNATFASAPFNADMQGNIVVNSLERNDFHWFTLFESVDGYVKQGNGSVTVSGNFVSVKTDVAEYDYYEIWKYSNYSVFSWNKKRKIKFQATFKQTTAQDVRLVSGDASTLETRKVGFYISNSTIYGILADGTSYDLLDCGTFSASTPMIFEAKFNPGVSVEFFIDGVSKGTLTNHFPINTTIAGIPMYVWVKSLTGGGAEREVQVGFWDFWQEN